MVLNQEWGANIPYPYHSLPLKSTEDRLGLFALLGIKESMEQDMPRVPSGAGGNKKTVLDLNLDCGKPPKDKIKCQQNQLK